MTLLTALPSVELDFNSERNFDSQCPQRFHVRRVGDLAVGTDLAHKALCCDPDQGRGNQEWLDPHVHQPGYSRRGIVGMQRGTVSYTHLRAHETRHDLVCRLLL